MPDLPAAAVHDAAFHDTSPAAHVVAPTFGGVKVEAPPFKEILNCAVVDARTIWLTVTVAAGATVLVLTLLTGNVTPAGTVTRALSVTFAAAAVTRLVSGRTTNVCAETPRVPAAQRTIAIAKARNGRFRLGSDAFKFPGDHERVVPRPFDRVPGAEGEDECAGRTIRRVGRAGRDRAVSRVAQRS